MILQKKKSIRGTIQAKGRGRARPVLERLEDRCLLDATPLPAPFGSSEAFVQFLRETAVEQYKDYFGARAPMWGPFMPPIYWRNVPMGFQTMGPAILGPVANAVDYSGTNNQVAGVNEADIIQTDGNYLYDLTHNQLVIFQTDAGAAPAVPPTIISRTEIEGSAVAEFLDGDRVTVISSIYDSSPYPYRMFDSIYQPWDQDSKIKVTVFDVADRTAPKIAAATYMDGNYINSRDIGGMVYIATTNSFVGLPAPEIVTANGEDVYETQEQYLTRVTGQELDLALPHTYTRDVGSGGKYQETGYYSDPAKILQPIGKDHTTLLTVSVFDTTKNTPGPVNDVSLLGAYASTLYASLDHLYIVSPNWEDYATESSSTIYRFDLAGKDIALSAIGKVTGQVGNQFSMDEYGDYFRIVTTTNWGANQTSNVFVLTANGDQLEEVGRLTGIAKGDRLFATRFFGDKAFIVTALIIDPLFTIDLSDPKAPKLVGELHIPGFSSYLHMIDDTHLIGIGRSDTRGGSLKVSLFDVSDFANPTEVDNYVIAPNGWNWWWGSGSEAEWDHHAFSYFPEYQTLAIPIYGLYQPIGLNSYASNPTYVSSLWVFSVDPATGFEVKGTIEHDSQVRRSLRIGDQLYSIAEDSVQVHPIKDPEAPAEDVRIVDYPRFADAPTLTATAGVSFTGIVQQFKILDPAGLTATIEWGDGHTSPGTIAPIAGSDDRYTVTGTHMYTRGGGRSIKVDFSKNGEDAGSLWNWTEVVGSTVTIVATPVATTGGTSFTLTATVAPSPGAAGTVSFFDNETAIPGGANIPLNNSKAVFTTTSLSFGAHSFTAIYSGATGFLAGASWPAWVNIAAPPTVTSFTVNGGNPAISSSQRSRVVDVTVSFDQAVQLDANAIKLTLHTNDVSLGGVAQPNGVGAIPTLKLTASGDMKTWQVTFSGAGSVDVGTDGFASLKDGVYDFTIDGAKVHPLSDSTVRMAGNSTTTVHRLYGDTGAAGTPAGGTAGADFEAVVNSGDNLAFRDAFNKPVGGGYQASFDFNGDGIVNSGDNLQFRSRFNKALTWRM
jgi:uncharacterized secreted protein with C-terminal beta-propeller domain